MSIQPLPVILEEEEERKAIERLKPPSSIVCRYSYMKLIGEFPYDGDEIPGCGTKLVIRTDRGTELAEMLTTTCTNSGCGSSITRKQMLEYIEQSGGKQFPFTTEGKVIRLATPDDIRDQTRLDGEKPQFIQTCRRLIRELKLDMKLVEVERLLGGERVIFYFTSEGRVDFRELVRQLAAEFHTRIEMHQVGARDEARLVADYEKCGQQCCCKQFLKVLKPVSMKSAKVQKATLDPTKISGRCGRLMCCLRYEDVTYTELRRRLPTRNTTVMTEDGPGRVVNTQILTQLVLVELDEGGLRQAYPVENIEQLSRQEVEDLRREREAKAAASAEKSAGRKSGSKRSDRSGPRRKLADEPMPTEESADEPTAEPRRPKPGQPLSESEVESREGGQAADLGPIAPPTGDPSTDDTTTSEPGDGTGDTTQPQDGNQGGGKRRGKRRRRRGGKKTGGGGGGGSQGSSDPQASGGENTGDGSGQGGGGGKKRSRRRRGRNRGKGGGGGAKGGGQDGGGS